MGSVAHEVRTGKSLISAVVAVIFLCLLCSPPAQGKWESEEHTCASKGGEYRVDTVPPKPIAVQRERKERRRAGGRDRAHDRRRELPDAVRRAERPLVRRGARDEDEAAACRAGSNVQQTSKRVRWCGSVPYAMSMITERESWRAMSIHTEFETPMFRATIFMIGKRG